MIDWLTLRLTPDRIPDPLRDALRARVGHVLAVNPDGTVQWCKPMRESIRSDSHQITVELGYFLRIFGSPARSVYGNNVFGSGDPVQCALDMISFAARHTGLAFPVDGWDCTRIDVTHNYDLRSPAEVRQALSALRMAEGGHYQVRTNAETVYWGSVRSGLRAGKAYAKGAHLRYQQKRDLCTVNDEELRLSDRLLRLEMSLRSQWLRERAGKRWDEFTEAELDKLHADYFGKLIGTVEVVEMDKLLEKLEKVAPTKGRALGAYRTWSLIKTVGVEEARASMPKQTWYAHKRWLFLAGLSWSDFRAGNVVQLRRVPIELGQPVRSWAELRKAA